VKGTTTEVSGGWLDVSESAVSAKAALVFVWRETDAVERPSEPWPSGVRPTGGAVENGRQGEGMPIVVNVIANASLKVIVFHNR
jgi:hypothetical protein